MGTIFLRHSVRIRLKVHDDVGRCKVVGALSCRVRQTRVFDDGRSENFPACTWLPSLLINKFTRQKRKTKSSATADIARDADVGAHSRSLKSIVQFTTYAH